MSNITKATPEEKKRRAKNWPDRYIYKEGWKMEFTYRPYYRRGQIRAVVFRDCGKTWYMGWNTKKEFINILTYLKSFLLLPPLPKKKKMSLKSFWAETDKIIKGSWSWLWAAKFLRVHWYPMAVMYDKKPRHKQIGAGIFFSKKEPIDIFQRAAQLLFDRFMSGNCFGAYLLCSQVR